METRFEHGSTPNSEQAVQKPLEAPFVSIVKRIVHKEIPQHQESFDITLDEINRQITGDGLNMWESKEHPGVRFLVGHLSVTPDLIKTIALSQRIAGKVPAPRIPQEPIVDKSRQHDPKPTPEHYVYFVHPSFGLPPDGSALSALDMGIDRFFKEMPRVAKAMRERKTPPTVDIYSVSGFTGLGAQVTKGFVEEVKRDGFEAYGKVYAELAQELLPKDEETLKKTRIVFQGVSKGTITADQTTRYLPEAIRRRTQRLFDNTAGSHGRNIPTQWGRSVNMGIGIAAEMAVRIGADLLGGSIIPKGAFKDQAKFYRDIMKAKNIPEDSEEQKKLKAELFVKIGDFLRFGGGSELKTIGRGTPLDNTQRSYSRISTSDPVNINYDNARRVDNVRNDEVILGGAYTVVREVVNRLGGKMKPWARRGLIAKDNGKIITFATSNIAHFYPWARSVRSGSWAQKMEYVENTNVRSPIAEDAVPEFINPVDGD